MASLAAIAPGAGLLPLEAGDVRVTEVTAPGVWSVMTFAGREAEVGAAMPCGWPEPGRVAEGGGALAMWFGQEQALVRGARPAGLGDLAAVTDQSDAWLWLRLEGAGAGAALARLVPIDLRPEAFPEGTSARTLCGHVAVGLLRRSGALELLAPRSMASTVAHDLERAIRSVAARL